MEILPRIGLQEVLITVLLGGVFVLVAVITFGIGVYMRRRAAASQQWPMVLGQVINSQVTSSSDGDGGVTYSPLIQYAYDLGGQAYQSNRVAFGGFTSTSSRRDAQKHTARYPIGAVVQVYYNPANPQDATLERRSGQAGFLLGFGCLFLLIGCGVSGIPAAIYVARQFVP